MKVIQLQVQDDYLEDFLKTLPADKVKLLDQAFLDTQKKFVLELEKFQNGTGQFSPYYEDMKEIDDWLKKEENSANS